jgi:hypothetical protein
MVSYSVTAVVLRSEQYRSEFGTSPIGFLLTLTFSLCDSSSYFELALALPEDLALFEGTR